VKIGKYSFGLGDRFNHQGEAQLKAIIMANEAGIPMIPVWNKSNREHQIIQTTPKQTRKEADEAVNSLVWEGDYYVDADHINLLNVDHFIQSSNFFTIDVADQIGVSAKQADIKKFVSSCKEMMGELRIPNIKEKFTITEDFVISVAKKYLFAVKEAGRIYRYIIQRKESNDFIPEISMDEVDQSQQPIEILFILKAVALEGIPIQTIAPKFTGRFNKGVDYMGNIRQFKKEFEQDLLILDYAIKEFKLPANLKLSIHSGSDKFSIYPVIGSLIKKYDKGIHIKTAGTTWLEEVIGLASADGAGLMIAKEIYKRAYERKNDLCIPYAAVIDIDHSKLPSPEEVRTWTAGKFASTLRHIPDHPDYNPNFRQLIHVGYKVAAEMGSDFYAALVKYAAIIEENVIENLFERHIKRLFLT